MQKRFAEATPQNIFDAYQEEWAPIGRLFPRRPTQVGYFAPYCFQLDSKTWFHFIHNLPVCIALALLSLISVNHLNTRDTYHKAGV